jgi:hypothetical protein
MLWSDAGTVVRYGQTESSPRPFGWVQAELDQAAASLYGILHALAHQHQRRRFRDMHDGDHVFAAFQVQQGEQDR